MSCAHLLLATALIAGSPRASAVEDTAQIAQFVESCERARRGAILQIEHELRRLRNERATTQQVKHLAARLDRLKSGEEVIVPTLQYPPQVGAIGKVPKQECYVDQVISPTELLVRCFFPVAVTTVKNFQAYRETTTQTVQCVLRGASLPEAREGQELDLRMPVVVVGRESYDVVGGPAKSILVLKPFDLGSIADQLKRRREAD